MKINTTSARYQAIEISKNYFFMGKTQFQNSNATCDPRKSNKLLITPTLVTSSGQELTDAVLISKLSFVPQKFRHLSNVLERGGSL